MSDIKVTVDASGSLVVTVLGEASPPTQFEVPPISSQDYGKLLVATVAGYLLFGITNKGNRVGRLSIPTTPVKTDANQPGIDQVWSLESNSPAGFSVGSLNIFGETFPNIQALKIPTALPPRWEGLMIESSILAQLGENLVVAWQPENQVLRVGLSADGTQPVLNLRIVRNVQGVPFRITYSVDEMFTADQFLASNGAAVGTSDKLSLPDHTNFPSLSSETSAYFGFWWPDTWEPLSLWVTRFFGSLFEPADNPVFHNLEVEGVPGKYWRNDFRLFDDAHLYDVSLRFPPDLGDGGTIFPLHLGPFQIFVESVTGNPVIPTGSLIDIYSNGLFFQ